MSVYKKIESVDRTSNVIHYEHFLSASTEGLSSISFISGSTNNKYWNSLNVLFYTSGSPTLSNVFDCHNCGDGVDQFDLPHTNFTIQNAYNPQHVNKFLVHLQQIIDDTEGTGDFKYGPFKFTINRKINVADSKKIITNPKVKKEHLYTIH